MNDKNNIEHLFKELQDKFDISEPNGGHQARFIKKLNAKTTTEDRKKTIPLWKPFLAIAASVVICISMFGLYNNQNETLDLASVSPKMEQTQNFFSATINEELKKLNDERSPLTKNRIDDATDKLKTLETDYEKLKIDLTDNTEDKRIIYAMISNFQSRIDLLNDVLNRIEDLKTFKNHTNATENTL